ncbi:hypothetical protein IJ182_08485 [bacterium]|nr:hypothetical protein [bacterium]
MEKKILLLKSDRVICFALLEQNKIVEAVQYFELYINKLKKLLKYKKYKKYIEEELTFSENIFYEKIFELAEEFYNNSDMANAAICYTFYFKHSQETENTCLIKKYIETLKSLKQIDIAVDLLNNIANISSKNKLLSELYADNADYNKAIKCMEQYIKEKSNCVSADDYNLLGCYYNSLFSDVSDNMADAEKSLKYFELASDMVVTNKLFSKNATVMAGKTGNMVACRKYWDRCLKIGNLTNDDKFDYASFCMKMADFETFYEYFEARFQKENNKTEFPFIKKPCWDGNSDISDKTLLIYFEQGYGDTFLMFGYMPQLLNLAKKVIFVVQNAVYPLLKNNEFGIEILPEMEEEYINDINFDYYIPSMSLFKALKINRNNISVGEGYIKADKLLSKNFKQRFFNNKKLKIGLSVSGNTLGDKTRDIPIDYLLPLDKLKNVELYMLTKGIDDDLLLKFKNNRVNNIGNNFADFNETAAAIENCDLVLTTDNCILNLAGAMGKRTYALFNNPSHFRWFDLSGKNMVWFTSVKPFVNKSYNAWNTSVSAIIKEIQKLSFSK